MEKNTTGIVVPLLSEELVSKLEEIYPDTCPSPQDDERTIWMDVGKIDVIRFLRDQFNRQQKTSYD